MKMGVDIPYFAGTVFQMDAVEMLNALSPNSVGAIVMDPPFFVGIGRAHDWTEKRGTGTDPWTPISDTDAMVAWSVTLAKAVSRVLRPGGACAVMGGSHSGAAWQVAADRVGLAWMAELTVLWNTGKPRGRNFGGLTTTVRWHTKPGNRHAFNTPQRSIYSNVIVADKIHPADSVHAAQKPVELTNFLVSLLTNSDDLVVDPFCGSGSTLVSAAICGRPFVGGDTDETHCATARRRVARYELEAAKLKPLHLWINGRLIPIEGDPA